MDDFARRPTRLTLLGWCVVPPFLIILAAMIVWLSIKVVWPLTLFIVESFSVWKEPVGYVVAGLMIAITLTVLRGSNRRVYGIVEIVFSFVALATTAAAVAVAKGEALLPVGIGFMSSVYVLIRGATNVWESLSTGRQIKLRSFFYSDNLGSL